MPGPDGFANPPHHVDVAVRIDADLDLDGADALLRNLRDFALRLFGANQSDRMGDRNAPAHRAAEQAMHRQPPLRGRQDHRRRIPPPPWHRGSP